MTTYNALNPISPHTTLRDLELVDRECAERFKGFALIALLDEEDAAVEMKRAAKAERKRLREEW